MANIPNRFTKGIVLRGESSDSGNEEGSLFLNSSSARIKTYVEGAVREVITSSQGQYLTNKTISTAENTIQVSATGVTATELDAALEEIQSNIASSISENLTFVKTDGSRNMTGGLTIANPSHVATLQLLEEDDTVKLNYVDTAGIYGGGTFTTDIYSGQIDVKHTSDGLTRIGIGYIAIENGDGSPRIPVSNSAVTPKKYVDDLNLSQIKNKQDLVDIFFDQTFEFASLANFTHTGLILTQTDPLHGNISALLTHQAGTSPANDQFFKEIIPVDRKFRGQTMVLRLDSKSSASQGNVVINIYDETNSANLVASEQLQLSNDVNGKKTSVSFTIPETCASLSYTITALPESGSPTTRIDDIICELAETALLETFSTDTASLVYASSETYTLSTLTTAPIGTFITFFFPSANSYSSMQTTNAAPSQTISSMNTNGIQLFAKSYGSTSNSNSPARIAIQIGKGMKGVNINGYAAAGKTTQMTLDNVTISTTNSFGSCNTYNELTGILDISVAEMLLSSGTKYVGYDSLGGAAYTSGYIVINASKNPSVIGRPDALSTATGNAPSYSARAWVNFNGTGTVAIRDSGNVSSITDNGTGAYRVNFTTAMNSTNYSTVGAVQRGSTNNDIVFRLNNTGGQTTTSVSIATGTGTTAVDAAIVNVAVFE